MTHILMQKNEEKAEGIEKVFYLLLEKTCDYGTAPSRALMILFYLIPVFFVLYLAGLQFERTLHFLLRFSIPSRFARAIRNGFGGIWKIWPADRIRQDEGTERPLRVDASKLSDGLGGIWKIWPADRIRQDGGTERPLRVDASKFSCVWHCFMFSVLSAFHLGWRDLNVGNWLARILPYEYNLRGTGWVKMLSGIQSLISIVLLVLFILTYFGSPFENL